MIPRWWAIPRCIQRRSAQQFLKLPTNSPRGAWKLGARDAALRFATKAASLGSTTEIVKTILGEMDVDDEAVEDDEADEGDEPGDED